MDCEKLIHNASEHELKAFIDLNEEITQRESYGLRNEIVECENPVFLIWSNASKKWHPAHPESLWMEGIKKGKEVKLDANHILSCSASYETAKKFSDCLKPLPLYSMSFESKRRNESDSFDATIQWAKKQLERINKSEWQKENR